MEVNIPPCCVLVCYTRQGYVCAEAFHAGHAAKDAIRWLGLGGPPGHQPRGAGIARRLLSQSQVTLGRGVSDGQAAPMRAPAEGVHGLESISAGAVTTANRIARIGFSAKEIATRRAYSSVCIVRTIVP
jgi:hypothetical protein